MTEVTATETVENEVKKVKARLLLLVGVSVFASVVFAQDTPVRTLFTHVHVFDGVHEKRIENVNVLIEDNLIAAVSSEPIEANGATAIDGGGRTLMPGLTDAHWHVMHAHAPTAAKQGKSLAKLKRWYEPWEVLRMATSTNYKLFKMSGPRDPYPGKNGVIEEGALADILLVDGNPLEDIDLIADPDRSFVLIMKDGKIFKDTLE